MNYYIFKSSGKLIYEGSDFYIAFSFLRDHGGHMYEAKSKDDACVLYEQDFLESHFQ